MPDHTGFRPWSTTDAAHPYPIGPIDLRFDSDEACGAELDIAFPPANPTPQTVAERSIGIANRGKLSFALRCTTQANGRIDMVGVFAAQHLHFWPAHNEDGPGPEQVFTVPMAQLRRGGSQEAIVPHGPHCDVISVDWGIRQGGIHVDMSFTHFQMSVQAFLDMRERNRRNAERKPRGIGNPFRPLPLPPIILPYDDGLDDEDDGGTPTPTPTPTGPTPTSALPGGGIGAVLAGALERVARWLRG